LIDRLRIAAEHEGLRAALGAAGAEVVLAATAADGNPDAIYVYDPVIVADSVPANEHQECLNKIAALGAATFKAARTISRDEVGSFIREPFVEGDGQDPVETGDLRQAIGELVTCSRCVGTWVAAGLTTTQVVAPRFGRLLTWSLAAAGVNDFLQAGFVALTPKSD